MKWRKPEKFRLETVLPDGKGGLFLVGDEVVLRRTAEGKVALHAKTGSTAGAVALAPDGALYLGREDRIERVSPDGKKVTKFADGFGDVYGLALHKDGALLAADWRAGKVYRIAKGKKKVLADGLSYPSGLVCDGAGHVYVKESGRQTGKDMTIRRIAPDGKVTLFATVPSR